MSVRSLVVSAFTTSRQTLTGLACLAFMAARGRTATADSIMGTVEMTLLPGTSTGGLPSTIASTGFGANGVLQPVNLGTLPLVLPLGGVSLGYNPAFTAAAIAYEEGQYNYNYNTQYNQTVNTTFVMKITFDGASGSQPTVELTGSFVGSYGGLAQYADMGGQFTATPTTATLENWSPSSGIPLALIDQYLNPASYHIEGSIGGSIMNDLGFTMTVDPPTGALPVSAPEPGTIIVYLAMFAGLGVRSAIRARWANSVVQ